MVNQQFHARDVAYRDNCPHGSFSVIELDGMPIGRLIVTHLDANELRMEWTAPS